MFNIKSTIDFVFQSLYYYVGYVFCQYLGDVLLRDFFTLCVDFNCLYHLSRGDIALVNLSIYEHICLSFINTICKSVSALKVSYVCLVLNIDIRPLVPVIFLLYVPMITFRSVSSSRSP